MLFGNDQAGAMSDAKQKSKNASRTVYIVWRERGQYHSGPYNSYTRAKQSYHGSVETLKRIRLIAAYLDGVKIQ